MTVRTPGTAVTLLPVGITLHVPSRRYPACVPSRHRDEIAPLHRDTGSPFEP